MQTPFSVSEHFNSSGLRAAASVIVQGTLIDVPDWQSALTALYSGHFHKGEKYDVVANPFS
jgi:hypothetical protein